jgi:hypothetical protein
MCCFIVSKNDLQLCKNRHVGILVTVTLFRQLAINFNVRKQVKLNKIAKLTLLYGNFSYCNCF